MMQSHVTPYLGEKKMNETTPADIIAWQNKIRNKNFSESYQRMLQNQVIALFTHAQKIYNLWNNPCKKVKKIGRFDVRRLEFWTYENLLPYEQDGYYYGTQDRQFREDNRNTSVFGK